MVLVGSSKLLSSPLSFSLAVVWATIAWQPNNPDQRYAARAIEWHWDTPSHRRTVMGRPRLVALDYVNLERGEVLRIVRVRLRTRIGDTNIWRIAHD